MTKQTEMLLLLCLYVTLTDWRGTTKDISLQHQGCGRQGTAANNESADSRNGVVLISLKIAVPDCES